METNERVIHSLSVEKKPDDRTRIARMTRIRADFVSVKIRMIRVIRVRFKLNWRIMQKLKPQIKAPRVAPLEGSSTSTVAPVDVAHTYGYRHMWRYVSMHCGGHNADERRLIAMHLCIHPEMNRCNDNQPQRTQRAQSVSAVLCVLCALCGY
jgi:hypothetical protein